MPSDCAVVYMFPIVWEEEVGHAGASVVGPGVFREGVFEEVGDAAAAEDFVFFYFSLGVAEGSEGVVGCVAEVFYCVEKSAV